jgi:hypothetical protein
MKLIAKSPLLQNDNLYWQAFIYFNSNLKYQVFIYFWRKNQEKKSLITIPNHYNKISDAKNKVKELSRKKLTSGYHVNDTADITN